MSSITLGEILEDLQLAEQGMRKFERRYWISSAHFLGLYSQGLLDNGENTDDFAEWSGYCKLHAKRQSALEQFSARRVEQLKQFTSPLGISLTPAEPTLNIA